MVLHIDVFVNSMEEMLDFYVNKLGFEKISDEIVTGELVKFVSKNKHNAFRLVLLKISCLGTMIELLQYEQENERNVFFEQKPITITILTPCLEKKVSQLAEKEVYPISDYYIVEQENGKKSKIVFFTDPENNYIEYLQILE